MLMHRSLKNNLKIYKHMKLAYLQSAFEKSRISTIEKSRIPTIEALQLQENILA